MIRAAGARAGLAALLALGLGSCFSFRWYRDHRNEELRAERVEELEVGRSDLTQCLELLGAPLYVWELPEGSFSIAYGWAHDRQFGGTARLPLRGYSPSYSFDDLEGGLRGLVLVFDADATLRVRREGYLREIAPELQRDRPADVEDLGPPPSDG